MSRSDRASSTPPPNSPATSASACRASNMRRSTISTTSRFGWQAGINVRPWAGGEIALGYRSRVDLSLSGDLSLPGGLPTPPFPPGGRFGVTGDVTLARSADAERGAADSSTQWKVLGSVEWKNWSLVQDVPFRTDGGGDAHQPHLPLQGRLEFGARRRIPVGRSADAARRRRLRDLAGPATNIATFRFRTMTASGCRPAPPMPSPTIGRSMSATAMPS